MNKYELTLNDYWRIIRRRRGSFLLSVVSVITATGIFTAIQTPVFESASTVRIEQSKSIPGASLDIGWDVWATVNTEVKVIKGMSVAERTAQKLGKITDQTSPEEREKISSRLRTAITAKREEESNIIKITGQASSGLEAARLANSAADAYIELGIEEKNKKAKELREFIGKQLDEAQEKLKVSEERMKVFLQKNKTKGLGSSLGQKELSLEEEKEVLLNNYTAAHPRVVKIEQQIASLHQQKRRLSGDELEHARLDREVKLNEDLYLLLARRHKEAQISEAEKDQTAFVVSRGPVPTAPVYPNTILNMIIGAALGGFLGIMIAFLMENLDTSIGTIEDVELYLQIPVLGIVPHISVTEGLSQLSKFQHFLHQFMKFFRFSKHSSSSSAPNTLEYSPLVERRRGQDRRSGIDRRGTSRSGPDRRKNADRRSDLNEARSRLLVFQPHGSPFVEAYHTLRTNIKWKLASKEGGKVLLLTSAGVGEGKTITSCNFALAAARTGIKTLLIESDLRKPMIGRLFGLPNEPGLSDCSFNKAPWREAIKGTSDFLMGELALDHLMKTPGIENFYIMTCGMVTPNPIDIFNTNTLNHLIKDLKRHFDLIIFDCSPVLLFADSLILGKQTDGAVLIYQAGRMAREALKRAKDQLSNSNIPVLGIVLNNLHASDMEPRYGYYYGHYYSHEPKHKTA